MSDEQSVGRNPRRCALTICMDLSRDTDEIDRDIMQRFPRVWAIHWELEHGCRSGWVYTGAAVLAKLEHNGPRAESLRIGDVLDGYCGGHFGRTYTDKRVEAIGADWVVARDVETGKPHFADSKPEELVEFRK